MKLQDSVSENEGTDFKLISGPLNIQVSCTGWDPDFQRDTLLNTVTVGVWVPAGGAAGKVLEKTFDNCHDLWLYMQRLNVDKAACLKTEFNYTGPIDHKSTEALPINLNDLF